VTGITWRSDGLLLYGILLNGEFPLGPSLISKGLLDSPSQ